MNLREALQYGEQYLAQRGIRDAQVDAWLLLEHVSGLSRAEYLARMKEPMEQELFGRYEELLARRGGHIPLQHLTGVQEFMGLSFQVSRDVLIPRQDTETLAEEALKRLRPGMRVLDLCTGSGCIAVSLAKLGPEYAACQAADCGSEQIRVDASDISAAALAVAEKNVRRHRVPVRLIQSDLFVGIPGVYDMIVSNPPYIRTQVIAGLDEEVRLHEPFQALDGREDGLYFYRKIAAGSREHLTAGGELLLEIGYDQAEEVTALLNQAGFEKIRTVRDLAGRDRVICACAEVTDSQDRDLSM